jgi:outer membrane protein assembly factor BamB
VIADGIVYVTTMNGYLYALSACNGSLLWRYHADAVGGGPPTVANGVVYFGAQDAFNPSGPNPPPSFLYAVDATTGALIWRASGPWYAGKLIVANGVIYAGSGENYVYAYQASDGKLLWGRSLGGGCDTNALAVDATYLYVNEFACYGVVALRVGDGTVAWHQIFGGAGAPTLVNGVLYVGPQALRASDGSILRTFQATFQASGGPFASDAVADGVVYIPNSPYLSAWNASTGAQLWQISPQRQQYIFGVGNGALYTGGSQYSSPSQPYDGHLYAFQASNGAQLWSALVDPVVPQFDPLPASLGSTLYVGTLTGAVVALRASDGAIMWTTMLQ